MKRVGLLGNLEVPNLEVQKVSTHNLGEDYLTIFSINAGMFFHCAHVISSDKSPIDSDEALSLVRAFSTDRLLYGKPEITCEGMLRNAKIWNSKNELAQDQIDLLKSELGESAVEIGIEEYGGDFRLWGASKVLEIRKLAFSPVWYALGVLIYMEKKHPFIAGCLWEVLFQKLQNEVYYDIVESKMNSVKEQREKGALGTQHKAARKRDLVIKIAAKLSQSMGAKFALLSDRQKVELIRSRALELDSELFNWNGKRQSLGYFQRIYEDHKLEIIELINQKKAKPL